MFDPRVLLICLGLEILLLAIRLFCVRMRLAPVPLRLPSLAILIWLILASLPASITATQYHLWLDSVRLLSCSYAVLQLVFWLGLELPAPIRWWPHPPKILRDLSALFIGLVLTLVVLQQAARINVVGLVTTSAILTAVIGLAAQEALKDLFAGIMLRVDSPFQEGDYLELDDGLNGWVDSLSLLSTRLRHVHGALITLPNTMMWQKNMRRFAPNGPIARELHINLASDFPPSQATELLMQVARNSQYVLQDPAPQAIVFAYHDYSITYELEVWQQDPTDIGYDDLRGELLGQIWYALERIGQRIPLPVHELKRHRDGAELEDLVGYDLSRRSAILAQSTLFSHLTDEQLANISNLTRCIRFARGELIVMEGEIGDTLYQIVSGRVQVIKELEGGELREVAQLEAPDIFGEMSAFSGEPRSATVRALDHCVLLEVERDDLRPLLEKYPSIVDKLARQINERRSELLELAPEVKIKQGNDLLDKMRKLFSRF